MDKKGKWRILVINPGSTSTKIAVFDDETEVFSTTLRHSTEELSPYPDIASQFEFRKKVILIELAKHNITPNDLDAIVGRGGLLYPMAGGTYAVNNIMLEHLQKGVQGQHASNLGGLLAASISHDAHDTPAFIVDPVVVDEMEPIAKLSGHPLLPRRSIFHALNQKAVARKAAKMLGKPYEELNLILVHMGGGISVGAHKYGKVIDVNNALDGDGPFAPERSGSLPVGDLAKLCFSGKYTLPQVMDMIRGKGGVVAYLGSNNMLEIQKRASAGDAECALILDGLIYQVSKEIGVCAVVLRGHVDAIVLTGGLAFNESICAEISNYISWIGKIIILAGEEEMEALAHGGLRVLNGEEDAKIYSPKT